MIYGYCRCSTNEDKQDINRQIRELINEGVQRQNIFAEYESGTKEDRLQLQELLDTVQAGDEIYAVEVSRISRSVKHLCSIIELAKDKKIKLVFGNLIVDCRNSDLDAFTEGVVKLIAVISEMERNILSERVKSGIVNARAKGKTLGRPPVTENNIPDLFFRYYPKYVSKEINKSEFARLCKLSYPSIYKYLSLVEYKK